MDKIKATKKKKYTILLTNDDGYDAKGINTLKKALKKTIKNARVVLIAPFSEKSACAHSISIKNSLELIKIKKDFYAVRDGTPTDCVCLGFSKMEHLPDIVVSGINNGANLAQDITYSGTLGACMESVLHGVKAVGLSQFYTKKSKFKRSSKLAAKLVKKILKDSSFMQEREFLNINYPDYKQDFKGYKISPLGKRVYTYESAEFEDPHGKTHYWIKNLNKDYNYEEVKKSDIHSVVNGYASITPISLDMTAYDSFKPLKRFLKQSNLFHKKPKDN